MNTLDRGAGRKSWRVTVRLVVEASAPRSHAELHRADNWGASFLRKAPKCSISAQNIGRLGPPASASELALGATRQREREMAPVSAVRRLERRLQERAPVRGGRGVGFRSLRRLRHLPPPQAGKVCLSGTVATDGWAQIVLQFAEFNKEFTKIVKTFDADARGITQAAALVIRPRPAG